MTGVTRWALVSPDAQTVKQISRATGISPIAATCLVNRGFKDPGKALDYLNARVGGLTPPDGHIDIELVDGENMRSTQLYASPLQEAGGASVVLYLVDTTEQKQLELQFAQ